MNTKSINLLLVLMMMACPLAFAVDKDWTFDPKTSTLIPKYLGKIKVLRGKAMIGERELKTGSKIYNDELVETEEKSYAVIEMIDLSLVTLGPKSAFKVENWNYKTKNDRTALYNVVKGQWRALIKSKAKEDDQLKIKTSLISMGVRGTELMVNVQGDKEHTSNQVALLEGKIHLEGDLPKELKKDMVPGDYAEIEKSQSGSKELKHKSRVLTREEMQTYQEQIAPMIPRLMELLASNNVQDKSTPALPESEIDPLSQQADKKAPSSKGLKENLEILNTTRENNRKSK